MATEANFSPLASPATPSRRMNKKERLKMISQITILDGTMDGKINVSLKIEDCSIVDDNSLSLLSMPDGPFMSSEPIKPSFHSFVITVQNGQRAYGGSYIFGLKQIARNEENDEHKVVHISRALVALTIRPLVDQLRKLLEWCVNQGGCNPRWLRCLANIRLPQKGKCIVIHLPNTKNLLKSKCTDDEMSTICTLDTSLINWNNEESNNSVAIFRPPNVFPLFDYSLRRLLTEVLTIDNLLLVYTCVLNELQILIVSHSYYNLMLISECLVALLNPFKWQHVYVPILPTKLGLHYLDAPTPFIMGINSRHRQIVKTSKVACIVDCDNNKIELNVENANLLIPFFIDDLRREIQEVINCDPRLQASLQQSEALKRVSELAHKYNVISDSFTYMDEVKFNQSIRILFFKKLKRHILNKYQHFIVCVGDKKDQVKFDTVSYLSDQPIDLRPFLQNFVETQMFASFIDEAGKTISRKQKNFFSDGNLADSVYGFDEEYEEIDLTLYSNQVIEARFENAQAINLVELEDFSTQANLLAVTMSPSKRRIQPNISLKTQSKLIPSSPSKQVPSALTSQTNWKVVETLLKEVKVKTKRILLAKMGSDETGNAISSSSVCMFEENSLISALCDLIERIWSHARSEDEGNSQWESSKCPFWSHLVAFHQSQPRNEQVEEKHHSTSDLHPTYDDHTYSWISLKKRIDSLSQLSLDQNGFSISDNKSNAINKPIPSSLWYDFNSICKMTDIKTDVGKSRAFIRLSLERKLLSKHLRSLLYNQELLQTLYKRYAFLRSEEEREQFITHLLTLNAVDLCCFTNTFTTSTIAYSLIICSTSSFSGWIYIAGSLGRMDDYVHIDTNQYDFIYKNFGQIYTLSISVNSKRKTFVEQCFIRNNVTNSLYKFDCGKWLGQSVDDGALERLLIAEPVHGTIKENIKRCSHSRSSSIGRNWALSSESSPKEEKYSVEDLQTMLGDTINHIMKYYFSEKIRNSTHSHQNNELQKPTRSLNLNVVKPANSSTLGKVNRAKSTSNSSNLVTLLFGHKKFLWVITQVFYYGFKNRRSFRRKTFLWDYLLRIQCELKHSSQSYLSGNDRQHDLVQLIEHITNKASTYGKDMKFQLFILLSLRNHQLSPGYLKLLAQQPLVQLHYENESFLRDANLLLFLTQILKTFNEIELKLDPCFTKKL